MPEGRKIEENPQKTWTLAFIPKAIMFRKWQVFWLVSLSKSFPFIRRQTVAIIKKIERLQHAHWNLQLREQSPDYTEFPFNLQSGEPKAVRK